jgi:hypothetical protein
MTVSQGLGGSWTLTIRDSSGNAYVGYTGAEALAGSVCAGRDSAALITLAPTWLSAIAGTITLPIAAADTADLDVGRYLVQVKLADDSAELYEGYLDVEYSPGSAAALTSYGGYQDLLDRAPWLEKLQKPTDLAGFAKQRSLARKWFESLLHRHYRGDGGPSTDFAFVPGISFGGLYDYYRDGRRSADLQGWLDADRLDVTEDVIEAVSCYAIALVCDRQVAPAKDDGGYAAAARKYFSRAENAATDCTCEVDSDGDGTNDLTIRLGVADTLEG